MSATARPRGRPSAGPTVVVDAHQMTIGAGPTSRNVTGAAVSVVRGPVRGQHVQPEVGRRGRATPSARGSPRAGCCPTRRAAAVPAPGSSAGRRVRSGRPGEVHRVERRVVGVPAAAGRPRPGPGRGRCRAARGAARAGSASSSARAPPWARWCTRLRRGRRRSRGFVDGVADPLQLRLLHRVGEARVAPDPGQRDHPVAVGDHRAVGGDEVRGRTGEQHRPGGEVGAQRADELAGEVLDARQRPVQPRRRAAGRRPGRRRGSTAWRPPARRRRRGC